jgi:hypothetical protein
MQKSTFLIAARVYKICGARSMPPTTFPCKNRPKPEKLGKYSELKKVRAEISATKTGNVAHRN